MHFYGIILLLSLLIHTKVFLLSILIILNAHYLIFLYNYDIDKNIRYYIIFNIFLTICLYGKNAILPLFMLYIYVFIVYVVLIIIKLYDILIYPENKSIYEAICEFIYKVV